MKIADLFRVQQHSSTYNESGNRRNVFYVESGMVVHYLYDNQLIPKLTPYFSLKFEKGLPVEEAIEKGFGMSAAEFDKMLRKYVSSGQYRYYAMPAPAGVPSKDYEMRPVSSGGSAAVIADIHLHSPDYRQQAEGEFREILNSDPNNAAALRGLGYANLQKGNMDAAGDFFKRAAQNDSTDPRVHYYSALLLNRSSSFNRPDEVKDMLRELDTAISLDPSFADAYTIRAFARIRAGEKSAGLADAEKAVLLSPRNPSYRINLAQMYLNNERVSDAVAVLQALQKSNDPELAGRASSMLEEARRHQAAMQAALAQREAAKVEKDAAAGTPAVSAAMAVPVKFIKGSIRSVDCSSLPSATLTVASGEKIWKMTVGDSNHVLLIGADGFSCEWKNQKVGLNYRETGDGAGSVVS